MNPSGAAKPETVKGLRAEVAELKAALRVWEERDRLRAEKEGETDPEGGVITPARMRKVMGQDESQDAGAAEKRIRDWLNKGVGAFVSKLREMEAEDAAAEKERARAKRTAERLAEVERELSELKAVRAGTDGGSAAARELIGRIMSEYGVKRPAQ